MPRETSPPSHQLPLPEVLRKAAHRLVSHASPVEKDGKKIGYRVPVRELERLFFVMKRMEERDGQYPPECWGIPR